METPAMTVASGPSVVVTGASRGIGAATARLLASRGARVVLAARDAEALGRVADDIRAAGGAALAVRCDVGRFEDVRAAVEAAVAAFGRIDALVNNAGAIEPIAPLGDGDPDAWGAAFDVNAKGVYYGMRAAIPPMLAQGGGAIVTVSSGAATSALEGWSQYCAGKAAALALTRCAHLEYGGRGIRVLGLSPGTVATDMQAAIRASGVNPVSRLDPSVHIPPEWAARAVAYLLDRRSDAHLGGDFSLKTAAGRAEVGLPPP
jgi:NAD(P)-dependent dehydrogenase (short-subunit alcohol dehydrogenase family)